MLYKKRPNAAELAPFGLEVDDYAHQFECDVWPENWRAVLFFDALSGGSWNIGPGGPTGLRYEAFREVRLAQGITGKEWPELFAQIQVMESAALKAMRED